jgi:hypothetical protein
MYRCWNYLNWLLRICSGTDAGLEDVEGPPAAQRSRVHVTRPAGASVAAGWSELVADARRGSRCTNPVVDCAQ